MAKIGGRFRHVRQLRVKAGLREHSNPSQRKTKAMTSLANCCFTKAMFLYFDLT